MNINYPFTNLYKNNLSISVEESQSKPNIILNLEPNKIYTLIMFDPDAVGGNKIHWLVCNIISNNISSGRTLIEYKGPAPPKNSGIHHYVFCLLEQKQKLLLDNLNLQFDSRFIELEKLFKKINLHNSDVKIVSIKYFIINTKNI
jgi:phosphatidylethanolamine-binding protein (PEBP) family uncharacterized protein